MAVFVCPVYIKDIDIFCIIFKQTYIAKVFAFFTEKSVKFKQINVDTFL